jgi:hypothetical protein
MHQEQYFGAQRMVRMNLPKIFLASVISTTLTKHHFRGTLSAHERIAYTNAVLCLQGKTALTPTSLIPGVRSRYDDFVGTHINQTLNIHYTVSHSSPPSLLWPLAHLLFLLPGDVPRVASLFYVEL